MLRWIGTLMPLLIVMIGLWPAIEGCNTNAEMCRRKMEKAMELPSAEQICTGMQEYLACVQEDIADCTDNSISDQYALNMVNSYCNKAYLCSDRLQKCYANFTQAVLITLSDSDNATRAQMCGSLVTPIMTCQEKVTSDCHDQAGLMETVASQQASLNSACSASVPCLGKVLQCQSSIIDMVPGDPDSSANQNQPSDCSAQKAVDYCGAYKQALNCMRANLTSCSDQIKVDSVIALLDNTTGTVCDPQVICSQNVSTCLCHINSQGTRDQASIMTSICSTYPPFSRCLDSLAPVCYANTDINTQVTSLKDGYKTYHTLFCTTEGGLCPPAIQCIANLSLPQTSSQQSSPAAQNDLKIDQLCLVASPVFKCLGPAGSQCGEQPGKVTFEQIEENFLDMCIEIAPHVTKLSNCPSFATCMRGYDLFDLGVSASNTSNQVDVLNIVRKMYAGLTKTDFWCSYLTHGYKCVAESAPSCALSEEFAAELMMKYTRINILCGGTTPTPPADGEENKNPGTDGGDTGTGGTNTGGTRDTDDGNGVSSKYSVNTGVLLATLTSTFALLRHH